MFASPDYTDAAEARSEKSHGSWADVDAGQLDAELCQHLITLPTGRVGWRISIPAMMSYWSELARDITLPPKGIHITVVRALKTSPPYVTEGLIAGLREQRGADFRLIDLDCNHMVPQAKPVEAARIIRAELGR
jgi:lipase